MIHCSLKCLTFWSYSISDNYKPIYYSINDVTGLKPAALHFTLRSRLIVELWYIIICVINKCISFVYAAIATS